MSLLERITRNTSKRSPRIWPMLAKCSHLEQRRLGCSVNTSVLCSLVRTHPAWEGWKRSLVLPGVKSGLRKWYILEMAEKWGNTKHPALRDKHLAGKGLSSETEKTRVFSEYSSSVFTCKDTSCLGRLE